MWPKRLKSIKLNFREQNCLNSGHRLVRNAVFFKFIVECCPGYVQNFGRFLQIVADEIEEINDVFFFELIESGEVIFVQEGDFC